MKDKVDKLYDASEVLLNIISEMKSDRYHISQLENARMAISLLTNAESLIVDVSGILEDL